MSTLRLIPVALVLALAVAPATSRAQGDLDAVANAISPSQIEIQWQWMEYNPPAPVGYPQWVGYDLYRRNPGQCSPWVRMNAGIIPRVPGATHGGTILDTPPAPLVTWEYQFLPVDAARSPVVLGFSDCEWPCEPHMWESIPKLAGPVVIGKVTSDIGWAVSITPCPDGCWSSGFYVSGQAADLLRPHLGSGETFRFYGDEVYGGFEGISLTLDRFEVTGCGPVPAARPSWGAVKMLYR